MVSRYQKGKTNLDFTEARDSEWQWHQLGHMLIYTSTSSVKLKMNSVANSFIGALCYHEYAKSTFTEQLIIYNC